MLPPLTIAKVGVENCAYSFDMLYSFCIPDCYANAVQPGARVLVPFGRGNNIRQGFVFSLESFDEESTNKLKSIYSVLDAEPLLNEEMILLALQLRERTFCTYFMAAKAMLPGGMCLKTEIVYSASKNAPSPDSITDALQMQIFRFLCSQKTAVREKKLMKKFGLTVSYPLQRLEKAGFIVSQTSAFSSVNDLTVRMVRLTAVAIEHITDIKVTSKQREVIGILTDFETASVKEICYYAGVTPAVIKTLEKNGYCEIYDMPVFRYPEEDASPSVAAPVLSSEQKKAFQTLSDAYLRHNSETALLFGVTGSGKTNVYLALIDRILENGQNVIVLLPEISLTAQAIALFRKRFGNSIAVLHSGLSLGERRDVFFKIKRGETRVVIGTRSAVFAPIDNIGAVIIDEEQEHTYKSEMSPRYDARIAAKFRCAYHNALLVLASATPSVETYAKALNGSYLLCELTKRYGKAVLPDVITVDMTDKKNTDRYSAICTPLVRALEQNLIDRKQSILLVNRRGYNTFVACEACKTVITCPKCSISMTYHAANNRLMCHYCGYSVPYTDKCPKCGNHNVRYAGFGTQRVEQELTSRFPNASILRMDADTTNTKNAHEKALSDFYNGKYDIMIGTQMVAKGLDFPNVTVVGIVSADNELYNDDFRSAEKTFDLITQVTGRAGRGVSPGRAFIQTVAPDNEILSIAAKQDYKRFFENEIRIRKAMIYPPFCDICKIGISADREDEALNAANAFFNLLITLNEAEYNLHFIVLGPLPPKVSKINNQFRQKIIIKCKNNSSFRALIDAALKNAGAMKECRNANIYAVINPENTD